MRRYGSLLNINPSYSTRRDLAFKTVASDITRQVNLLAMVKTWHIHKIP